MKSLLCLLILFVFSCQPKPVWTRHVIDDFSRGADGVRLADVNGDGLMDVATGWEEGGKIRVCLNPNAAKAKQKWQAVTVGEVRSPEDAVFVDLDNDDAVDVVSCCEGDTKTMWVHWAPKDKSSYLDSGAWKTEAIPAARGNKRWMFCLPMQVDGKNGVDLVAGAKDAEAQIGWLEAPANPRDLAVWKWHPICDAGWVMSLIASDVDGDGDLDVIASDRKGARRGCYWLENARTPQGVSWNVHPIGAVGQEVMFVVLTDLDRDGLLDVLAAIRGGDFVYMRRKSRSPIAWESFPIQIPPHAGNGKAVNVGDINLDGKPDIVFTCEGSDGKSCVMWMSYRRSPTDYVWDAHDISGAEGSKFDLVQLLDLDGDGDLDVMTCEERRNLGVIWYENPTQS